MEYEIIKHLDFKKNVKYLENYVGIVVCLSSQPHACASYTKRINRVYLPSKIKLYPDQSR